MPEILRRCLSIILIIGFIISAVISTTLGWQSLNQISFSQLMGDNNLPVNVELTVKEKNEEEKPIPGTVFYLFSSDGNQIGGRYVTDENGKINVCLTKGDYYFEEVTPSTGYTFDEKDGEKITKYPFTVSGDEEETIIVEAYNIRLNGSLLVRKSVENIDGSLLTQTQLQQEFTFNITFSDSGTYTYSVGNGQKKTITSGGTFTLKHGQTAVFDEIPVGVLYNITEVPIPGYVINSNGHQGHITENGAVAVFTNTYDTINLGSITVTKQVIGEKANPEQEFTFTANIGGKEETFTLKNGESKTFSNIPINTEYVVTENDLTQQGYISTTKEYKGQINATDTVYLPFVNVYDENPEGKTGSITIEKEVIGNNADLNKEFTFEINFDGTGAPKDTTFKLKANEKITFDNIPYGVTYTVDEINSNGYNPIIKSSSGSIAGDQTININFQNAVPEQSKVKLSITKKLAGEYLETDKKKEFNFVLLVDGQETKFTLKAGETKEFYLQEGSTYEICEDDYFSDGYIQEISNGSGIAGKSNINTTITNTYVGEVKKVITGEKKWKINPKSKGTPPETISVQLKNEDLLLEEKEIKPDENGKWNYTFIAPKYDANGNEINYTVEEVPVQSFITTYDGYNIINTYVEPIDVNLPTIENVTQGTDIPKTKFEFVLKGQNGAPMPDGSDNYTKVMSLDGAGTLEFGSITFTDPGVYTYTISELNGGIKGWTYDGTIYTITITITESNGKLSSKMDIQKNGEVSKKIVFTNIYNQAVLGENVIITGEKIWQHGDNSKDKYPTSIIVNVYGDGNLAVQKQVTASDDWKYSFELPKFAADGHEIVYTIDEVDVTGYSKTIDGYDIINKYVGATDITDTTTSSTSSTAPNPKTGDNIQLWVGLMISSGTMLIILRFIDTKKGKHYKK